MLSFLILFLIVAGCGSVNKITGNEQEELDQNLAGYKGVLLIKRNYANKNGYNVLDRTVNQAFKKHYKGEFLLVTDRQLAEYTDLDKYRFLFTPGIYEYRSGNEYLHNTNIDMLDRKTGKVTTTRWFSGYAAWSVYPPLMEKLRTSK